MKIVSISANRKIYSKRAVYRGVANKSAVDRGNTVAEKINEKRNLKKKLL